MVATSPEIERVDLVRFSEVPEHCRAIKKNSLPHLLRTRDHNGLEKIIVWMGRVPCVRIADLNAWVDTRKGTRA